jgi:hypothetical protein
MYDNNEQINEIKEKRYLQTQKKRTHHSKQWNVQRMI